MIPTVNPVRYWVAALFVVLGHSFLDLGSRFCVDAFEENFDGTRPFGRLGRHYGGRVE